MDFVYQGTIYGTGYGTGAAYTQDFPRWLSASVDSAPVEAVDNKNWWFGSSDLFFNGYSI